MGGGREVVISIGRVVVPALKIVINLPSTYEKLPCKEEPDQFSDPLVRSFGTHTQRQTERHPVT